MTFQCFLYEDGIAETTIAAGAYGGTGIPAPDPRLYACGRLYALSSNDVSCPLDNRGSDKGTGGKVQGGLDAMKSMPNLLHMDEMSATEAPSEPPKGEFSRGANGDLRFYCGNPGYAAKAEKVLDVYGVLDMNPRKSKHKRSLSDKVIKVIKRTASLKSHGRRVCSDPIPKQGWD
ncbi:hypothetical protein HDZ31DRAFT_65364 [Schizophyllum fasciatum]